LFIWGQEIERYEALKVPAATFDALMAELRRQTTSMIPAFPPAG
jgi:hypothetical protein